MDCQGTLVYSPVKYTGGPDTPVLVFPCNLLKPKGGTYMAAKFRVTTPDITLQFWEQSFSIMGRTIWTGRVIEHAEAQGIANAMQSLVDYGRDNRQFRANTAMMVNDDYLVQENEELKQRLTDLGEDI